MDDFTQHLKNNASETNNIAHDLLIVLFITFCQIIFTAIERCLLKLYKFISLVRIFCIESLFRTILINLTKIFVIPVINDLYPIFDIERKFDKILNRYDDSTNDLTQADWNFYVLSLKQTDNLDFFDILISKKLDEINFNITVAINRSSGEPRSITFATFYSKLYEVLGEAINIKYRLTNNKVFFVGVLGDDSCYRKFRFCDDI